MGTAVPRRAETMAVRERLDSGRSRSTWPWHPMEENNGQPPTAPGGSSPVTPSPANANPEQSCAPGPG
jgi:hypothetical protein